MQRDANASVVLVGLRHVVTQAMRGAWFANRCDIAISIAERSLYVAFPRCPAAVPRRRSFPRSATHALVNAFQCDENYNRTSCTLKKSWMYTGCPVKIVVVLRFFSTRLHYGAIRLQRKKLTHSNACFHV